MRTSRVMGLSTVLLGLVLAACSGDVTSSDEYLAIEAEMASAVEAQGEAATLLEEAQSELATKQTAVEEAQDQAREAQATAAQFTERAEEAEAALDEVMNAEWPDAVRSEFINGCAAEADVGGEADGEAIAFCTCTVDHLQSSMSLVDFLVFSIDAATSEGDVNFFGVPADMSPEFFSAFTDAAVACAFDSSAKPGAANPALSVLVDEAAAAIELDGYFVEDGVTGDLQAVHDGSRRAKAAGGELSIVVLSTDRTAHTEAIADLMLDALGGTGTVLVVAPETVGWASENDIYTQQQLDEALDVSLDGISDVRVVELFVATLTGEPGGSSG